MARVALIGSPLKRRHSKVMHDAAFEHFGVDARYELIELPPEGLDEFFATARQADWLGFQVTAPYKQEALARCDRATEAARTIGAVNTVTRVTGGVLVGSNTDAPGFARSVIQDLGRDMAGIEVAVAGAGGAARAVVSAATDAGATLVTVGSRDVSRAQGLADQFGDDRVRPVALDGEFDDALSTAGLAVNATTVGMIDAGTPFDPSLLPADAAVFDLVYVPADGELVTTARSRGLDAVDGAGMLVAQAEIAFEDWTGHAGAGEVMRAALARMG